MQREKKTEIITLRVTPRTKERIRAKAQELGLTVTDYLCLCGLGKQIVRVDGLDPIRSELKAQGRNLPQTSGPQEQSLQAEMENLLAVASALYRQGQEDRVILKQLAERTAAHTAALERLSAQREDTSTQESLEELAREVAQLRAAVRQAGRKKECSISPPGLDTALSVLA